MLENATIPFTIIKENNGSAVGIVGNQYKWTKTLHTQEKLNYLIENITLLQEPTETLNMDVTLSYEMNCECKAECSIQCSQCRRKLQSLTSYSSYCNFCGYNTSQAHMPKTICDNKKSTISYDLKIEFHNYLHEFNSNYSYEVVCKIPSVNEPHEYLFTCVERRSDKAIIFKKRYASTACYDKLNFSNSTMYFGIRRLNSRESEISMSALLNVISTFQYMDDKDRVILQAKDGQITAHASILSQYSDVFRAMFEHEMKEKQDGVVQIPDVEIKVIKKMIDYLYTGKLENITGITEELFKVAHRYQIHGLCHCCEEYYIFNVQPNNDNIVEMLQLVDIYELKELKNSVEKFVRGHEKVLTTLPRYQKYLCESINIAKATGTLISANKYNMKDVKTSALDFIKFNYDKMVNCEDFLKLFNSNPDLMKEVYIFSFLKNV